MFVVWGDIADPGVQSYRVVFDSDLFEGCVEEEGVSDLFEVGLFTFDMTEQRFDVALVGGCAWSADVHSEGVEGHELSGGSRHHLWPAVGDG